MSISNLSFSADLLPFNYTNGYGNNFSNTEVSVSGNLSIATSGNTPQDKTTTISSSVTSNGVNYLATGASTVGNLLTVFYQTPSDTTNVSPDTDINGTGVSFAPQSSVTQGGTNTVSYETTPNNDLNYTLQNAATSTGVSDSNTNLVLQSIAVVGGSLQATYEITGGPLPNNVQLAPAQAPPVLASVTTTAPGPVPPSGNQFAFSSEGPSTIGELLASTNNLAATGTLTGALQPASQSLSTSPPSTDATLAAALDPNINLTPSSLVTVADFINAGSNAFPTSAPSTPADSNAAANAYAASNDLVPSDNTNGDQGNSFSFGASTPAYDTSNTDFGSNSSGTDTGSFTTAPATFSDQTGIYSAVANASASTILGSNVSTVA